ncbi:MAG: 2-oxoacid:acceptor oxidoreductase family protein [Nanoarchaeota archaeon]
MRITILFGGPAGTGPNIISNLLGKALVEQGWYVFYSRDYESLIRGGHNFNVLTFSDKPVYSNDSKIDILVALDENTEKIHKPILKKDNIILNGKHQNMYFAGRIFKLLCIDFKILEKQLKTLKKNLQENLEEAKKGYTEEKKNFCTIISKKTDNYFMNGSQGIAEGAIKSGIDVYYAYPMTPATSILGELAEKQLENNILVLELESELAVINAAIGSSLTGAKAMIGTSGGGFDLMTEALSMTGMAEIPLVIYLSQRPGPGTGVATYTSQGDLNAALKSGHGEFSRTVFAPGDPLESQELVSQAFYFSQKYKIPSIILGDKHLAECFYTIDKKPEITKSEKTMKLARYNSYEADKSTMSATEDPEIIEKNSINRLKKKISLEKEAKSFTQYKVYGNKNSKNVIVSWGSTKGAIFDAIKDLNCKFVQLLYLEPFPKGINKEIKDSNILIVENNLESPLSSLLAEKLGIFIQDKNKILKFNGRPFLADELNEEIKKRLKT